MSVFQFTTYREHLTQEMLNRAYGHAGKTFRKEDEARKYASKFPNARIYRLFNYHAADIEFRGGIKPGAVKKDAGWLVQTTEDLALRNPWKH